MCNFLGPPVNLATFLHDISFCVHDMSKKHCVTWSSGVHVNLHLEQGSEISSQVVTGDTCQDACTCTV